MWRDGRTALALGTLVALLVAAGLTGWQHRQDLSRQQAAAQAAERNRWLSQPERDPHSAAHFGATVFKAPSALGWLDPGVDPWSGVAVFLEPHKRNTPGFAPSDDAAPLERSGDLTIATTLQLLVPLIIILLGFASFTSERERGTLRQLVGLGARVRVLALGKLIAVALVPALVLVPFGVLAAVIVVTTSPRPDADLVRLAAAAGGYAGYLALFLLVTVLASATFRSSAVALVALLGFWFVNGYIAPRLAADLAMDRHPVPSAASLAAAEATIAQSLRAQRISRAQFETEQLERYGVRSAAELPVDISGLWLQLNEELTDVAIDSAAQPLVRAYDRQERLRMRLGYAAPMVAIEALSMALAATDFSHQRAFLDSVEVYRRGLVRTLNDAIAENPRADGSRYVAGRGLWEGVPPFAYRQPPLRHAIHARRDSLFALALWLTTAGVLLASSLRRVRVRA